eukprot:2518996-Amphidinium_carterae.1
MTNRITQPRPLSENDTESWQNENKVILTDLKDHHSFNTAALICQRTSACLQMVPPASVKAGVHPSSPQTTIWVNVEKSHYASPKSGPTLIEPSHISHIGCKVKQEQRRWCYNLLRNEVHFAFLQQWPRLGGKGGSVLRLEASWNLFVTDVCGWLVPHTAQQVAKVAHCLTELNAQRESAVEEALR